MPKDVVGISWAGSAAAAAADQGGCFWPKLVWLFGLISVATICLGDASWLSQF